MSNPLISFVVPTRDRPELLEICLESLAANPSLNAEVIVSDNSSENTAEPIFARYAAKNWKYVSPDADLSMCDSWEFALGEASGTYVSYLTDKLALLPGAIDIIERNLAACDADIVNWWPEFFSPKTADDGFQAGYYQKGWLAGEPVRYEPEVALKGLLSMKTPTGAEGRKYYWGKICYGAYKRTLVDRIKQRFGRVFHEVSPDFTSTVLAFSLAESAVDLARPLLTALVLPGVSTGLLTSRSTAATEALYKTIPNGQEMIDLLPEPELFMSTHNSLARDFWSMARLGAHDVDIPELPMTRLHLRMLGDLSQIFWDNENSMTGAFGKLEELLGEDSLLEKVDPACRQVGRFDERIQLHIDNILKNAEATKAEYGSAAAAMREIVTDYAHKPVENAPLMYDTRSVDADRKRLGPLATALLDHLLQRAAMDSSVRDLFDAMVQTLERGAAAPEMADLLSVKPRVDADVMVCVMLTAYLAREKLHHLPSDLIALVDAGVVVPSDLVSTYLCEEVDLEDVYLEELAGVLRRGEHIGVFRRRLEKAISDDPSLLAILFCLENKYSAPALIDSSKWLASKSLPANNDPFWQTVVQWCGLGGSESSSSNGTILSDGDFQILTALAAAEFDDWNAVSSYCADYKRADVPQVSDCHALVRCGLAARLEFRGGNMQETITHCIEGLARANDLGGRPLWSAEFNALVASVFGALNEPLIGLGYLEQERALLEIAYGQKDWRLIDNLEKTISVLEKLRRPAALELAEKILEIYAYAFGPKADGLVHYQRMRDRLAQFFG